MLLAPTRSPRRPRTRDAALLVVVAVVAVLVVAARRFLSGPPAAVPLLLPSRGADHP